MNIISILQALSRREGVDYSNHFDHNGDPMCADAGANCAYCTAVLEARAIVRDHEHAGELEFATHAVGDRVLVAGQAHGRVESVQVRYGVRLGEGPASAVGVFAGQWLRELNDGTTTFWADPSGDVWERQEFTKKMRFAAYADGEVVGSDGASVVRPSNDSTLRSFDETQKAWGKLTRVADPRA